MRRALTTLVLAAAVAACGGGGDDDEPTPAGEATPAQLPPAASERVEGGRQLVAQSGCLACHRIGRVGNAGPGPELSTVGERITAEVIARVLVDPQPPMPSYEDLPARDREAIVDYLVTLEGRNERRR